MVEPTTGPSGRERREGVPSTGPSSLMGRLLVAARKAEEAERELAEARAGFDRERDLGSLLRLERGSREALARELEFEALWSQTAKEWFGPGPRKR